MRVIGMATGAAGVGGLTPAGAGDMIRRASPGRSPCRTWGRSSVGRARRSQCRGQGFDSPRLHHLPSSGLGRYPDVSLAQVREAAAKHRSVIAVGGDPLAEKRKAAIPTFRETAERMFAANKPRWRNGKHTVSWWQSLERHAFPIIGDMPVDRIDEEDVLRILTPTWGVRMETARRVRQRIRTVLKWAMAHKFVRQDVAGAAIDGALPPMPKVKNHLRAMP